jgi:hypothetical protein
MGADMHTTGSRLPWTIEITTKGMAYSSTKAIFGWSPSMRLACSKTGLDVGFHLLVNQRTQHVRASK